MVGGVNKENMESKFKVGDEFIGFKYHKNDTCYHTIAMSNYVGIKGQIVGIYDCGDLLVKFPDGVIWSYPNNISNNVTDIHTDIQSLKDKYPQFNITVSVEERKDG